MGLFACLYLSLGGIPPPPVGFGTHGKSRGGGGFDIFRVFGGGVGGGGGGGGVALFVGLCGVLCFLDPVAVLYEHSVLPWKMLRRGGACVWNCGPGVLWDPFMISRSLAIIPCVILGLVYIGCFGR